MFNVIRFAYSMRFAIQCDPVFVQCNLFNVVQFAIQCDPVYQFNVVQLAIQCDPVYQFNVVQLAIQWDPVCKFNVIQLALQCDSMKPLLKDSNIHVIQTDTTFTVIQTTFPLQ